MVWGLSLTNVMGVSLLNFPKGDGIELTQIDITGISLIRLPVASDSKKASISNKCACICICSFDYFFPSIVFIALPKYIWALHSTGLIWIALLYFLFNKHNTWFAYHAQLLHFHTVNTTLYQLQETVCNTCPLLILNLKFRIQFFFQL